MNFGRVTLPIPSRLAKFWPIGLLVLFATTALLVRAADRAPAPTRADLSYGPHARNVLDFWAAPGSSADKPAPLVIYFHGGGFSHGDKSKLRESALVQQCLDAGISVAAANYRLRDTTPLPDILRDCARVVQFLRSQAGSLHLDAQRIAVYGSSAGAGTSIWLAVHDDLADPANPDPVLRESTRVACAGSVSGQFSYDILRWPELFGDKVFARYGRAYANPAFYGLKTEEELRGPEGARIRADCDMLKLMTAHCPPLFISSSLPDLTLETGNQFLHHPTHSQKLYDRARELGVPVVASIPALKIAPPSDGPQTLRDFLFLHLGVTSPKK